MSNDTPQHVIDEQNGLLKPFKAMQIMGTFGEAECDIEKFNGDMAVCPSELDQGPVIITKQQALDFFGVPPTLTGWLVVGVDNLDRDNVPDILIANSIPNSVTGEILAKSLNEQANLGDQSGTYYKCVYADYTPRGDLEEVLHASWAEFYFPSKKGSNEV